MLLFEDCESSLLIFSRPLKRTYFTHGVQGRRDIKIDETTFFSKWCLGANVFDSNIIQLTNGSK